MLATSDAQQLSHELRETVSPDMRRRRWIVGLSMVGVAAGAIVGLYQMGVFRRIPDLPVAPFAASRVDVAPYAYKRLATPDGLLMLVSYGLTAILAGAGGRDRNREMPPLAIALAAKTGYDAWLGVKLAREEWADTKALCGYCQAATIASLASFALALPAALEAVRR